MFNLNYLYNAGSLLPDINDVFVRLYDGDKSVGDIKLSNCSIKDGSLFADDLKDIDIYFDGTQVFNNDSQLTGIRHHKHYTSHHDGAKYCLFWPNTGVCQVLS